MSFIVAIDGPAGTGKGTVTEKLAQKLKLTTIDTGAMYRCVALATLKRKIPLEQKSQIEKLAKQINIQLVKQGKKSKVLLDGEDVTNQIRERQVTEIVSQVSSIIPVRMQMVALQRKMAEGKDVIMEGRDIGTYVFPNADLKIYLDADIEERANRRFKQEQEKNTNMTYQEVLDNIKKRDENDRNKEIGALKIAEDAIVIDTTKKTIQEVVKELETIIKEKKKEKKLEEEIYSVRPDTKWKLFEQKVTKLVLGTLYRCIYRVKIEGSIPEKGAYIICSNHINYLDAAAIVLFNKRKISFIAKHDLYYNKTLSWLAHVFDIIPIKRGKQDLESMKRSIRFLKNGGALGIFPEGTRKGLQKQVKAKNGAAFMALRTGTPVIPVGIQGSFKPFSKVYIRYGKSLDFSEYKGKTRRKGSFRSSNTTNNGTDHYVDK